MGIRKQVNNWCRSTFLRQPGSAIHTSLKISTQTGWRRHLQSLELYFGEQTRLLCCTLTLGRICFRPCTGAFPLCTCLVFSGSPALSWSNCTDLVALTITIIYMLITGLSILKITHTHTHGGSILPCWVNDGSACSSDDA